MTIEILDKAPYIGLPTRFLFTVWWPWVQNYNGELRAGAVRPGPIYARIWITKFVFAAKQPSRASNNPVPPDYLSRFRIFLRMQLARGFCLCVPLLRFFFAPEFIEQVSIVFHPSREIRMIRRQTNLPDLQRALMQRLGLGVLALGFVEPRQVVEAQRHIGMLGAEGFFVDRQGFSQQ